MGQVIQLENSPRMVITIVNSSSEAIYVDMSGAQFNNAVPGQNECSEAKANMPKEEFQTNCKNCAGMLDLYVDACGYCGTFHREPKPPPIPVESFPIEPPPVKPKISSRKWTWYLMMALSVIGGIFFAMAFQQHHRKRY